MPEAQKNDYLTSILSIPNNKEDTTEQIINATKYIKKFLLQALQIYLLEEPLMCNEMPLKMLQILQSQ